MNLENEKVLIAYFSHQGENYFDGKIVDLQVGNTARVAKILEKLTNGDLFEIETIESYPMGYDECTKVAKSELEKNARPRLLNEIELAAYDVLFLGYPNWWGTMPMPVWTFLSTHDLSDKTIYPFCTHEGSVMGKSEYDLKRLCPNSNLMNGFAIKGSMVDQGEVAVKRWLEGEQ